MPRMTIPGATMSIRTLDVARALAEKVAASLSLVMDRDLEFTLDAYDAVTPPLEYPENEHVGLEFRVDGAARGKLLLVLSLRDAASLCGLLGMLGISQIEERRKKPALDAEDGDSLHEIANLLRGAIEEALRDIAPSPMQVAAGAAGELTAALGASVATWPRSLAARGRFGIFGLESGPAEILIDAAVARALDPNFTLEAAEAPPRGPAAAAAGEPPDAAAPSPLPTVIALEADPFYLQLLASVLGPSAQVVTVSSIQKLKGLLQHRPNATLVIDVAEDDEEVLREIAAIRKSSEPPEVLATIAAAKRPLVMRLAQAGVKNILPKPYSRSAVAKHLAALLKG